MKRQTLFLAVAMIVFSAMTVCAQKRGNKMNNEISMI